MTRSRAMGVAIAAVVAAIAAPFLQSPAGVSVVDAAGPTLNGGGSSFAKLEIDQWTSEVAQKPFELNINYVAQGSSFGRQQYISGSLDFAASDIPFTGGELSNLPAARQDFVYVPVSAGGLGFMYNLIDVQGQRVTTLNLTPRLACRMFTDPDMRWNDPELQGVNTQILLPDERIRAVVRSDGSGTSYVLSEFCIATAQDVWAPFVASKQTDPNVDQVFMSGGPTSNWPSGFGSALGADGVAAAVADSSGLYGITYNEAGFAKVRGFPNASVSNAAGVFTQPTEAAVSIALGYASGRENGTFKLDFDGPDPQAYFPSTYSYVIAQTTGFDPAKGEVLARFLCYSITKGQRVSLTENLGYARLSAPLVELGKNAIAQIPGAPPWDQCKVESAPPPPPPVVIVVPSETPPPAGPPPAGDNAPAGGPTPAGDATPADGATPANGTTPSGGTTASGTPSGGSKSRTGSQTAQTVVSIDPVTGETITATVPVIQSESGCTDPLTGLPADCSTTGGALEVDREESGAGAGAAASGATPAAANPPISDDKGGPNATRIVWWLLQGASVCAVGVALAGARRRFA